MDYDLFTQNFPPEIKGHLDIILAESGLPKTDPLVKMLLMQVHISEVIERRKRRVLCLSAMVICLLAAGLGFSVGHSNRLQDQNKAVMIDTGIRVPKDAWVKSDKLFVTYK